MDRLRAYWDFDDLDGTEKRLRAQLEREPDDAGRAEVLTQLARVEGLRDEFDAGDRLLDDAERLGTESPLVAARILLERGRLRNSSGDTERASRLFVEAYETALEAGEGFIAGDAAHMAAIAGDTREWTRRGLELAERDPNAAYWAGTLLNNLGWWHHERGEHEEALAAFEAALAARERDPSLEPQIAHAHYALSVCLRSLDRLDEAVTHAERAVAWADRTGRAVPYLREELAEVQRLRAGRADVHGDGPGDLGGVPRAADDGDAVAAGPEPPVEDPA
jgi:tetratricopeptide (TPR) repeat protein